MAALRKLAADDTSATFRVGEGDEAAERVVALADVDRARTVFEWGPQPKKGGARKKKAAAPKSAKQTSKKESS